MKTLDRLVWGTAVLLLSAGSSKAIFSVFVNAPGSVMAGQSYGVSASAADDFGQLQVLTLTRSGQYVASAYGSGWGTYSLSVSATETAPSSSTTLYYYALADTVDYSSSASATTTVTALPQVTAIVSSIGTVYPGDAFKPRVTATHSGGSLASIHIFVGGAPSNYNDYTYANAFVGASGSSSTVDGNPITAGNAGTSYAVYAMAEITGNYYSALYGPVYITVQKRDQTVYSASKTITYG